MRFRLFSVLVLLCVSTHATVLGDTPDGEHVLVRMLPDIKQLITQPGVPLTTVIDIGKTYRESPEFNGVEPELELVEKGKVANVEPTLENDLLTLHWKQIGTSNITLRAYNPETKTIYIERILLEAWTPDYLSVCLMVVGGLGLFLLGMRFMSEGIQMVAGAGLRRMIATLTDNRFTAVIVGVLVTATIQSSSVTTVMVVGFINSQIMTLSQGIGVIMGANIGTTMTGWILSLNLGQYGLPIMGVAAFFYLFCKNERTRFIGMACMGFGALFFGLELMSNGFKPLRELPEFTEWMKTFSADTYLGVLKCAAVGCTLTLIIQSSSAALGITISLAAIGVISFESAAALVIGEKLGTTITAVLASIGTSANARRAAYFHVLFNLTALAYITSCFLWILMPVVKWLVGVDENGVILNSTVGIALTHTLCSVFNMLLFLPFTRIIANLLTRYVLASNEPAEKMQRTNLGTRVLEPPSISIERSRNEVLRMGNICELLSQRVLNIIKSETPDLRKVDDSLHDEEVLDSLQDEIIEFVSSILSGNISHDVADSARQQLRMADELESISDYLITIMKSDIKLRKSELSLPEPEKSEIIEAHAAINEMIGKIIRYYVERKSGTESGRIFVTDVQSQGRDINRKAKDIRNKFMRRMSEEHFDPQVVIALNTQINAYRRVREHVRNVARAIVGVR